MELFLHTLFKNRLLKLGMVANVPAFASTLGGGGRRTVGFNDLKKPCLKFARKREMACEGGLMLRSGVQSLVL